MAARKWAHGKTLVRLKKTDQFQARLGVNCCLWQRNVRGLDLLKAPVNCSELSRLSHSRVYQW